MGNIKMKELYSYKSKNKEDGKTYTFIIKKPTRTDLEDIEIYNAAMISALMNKGVQTIAAVDKYYVDQLGPEAAQTKEDYQEVNDLKQDLFNKQQELIKLGSEGIKEEATQEILNEILAIKDQIVNHQTKYSEIYNKTAEYISRNKTIDYCLLHYTYIQEDEGEIVALYPSSKRNEEEALEEKYSVADKMIEEANIFLLKNIDKITFVYTMWYLGAAKEAEEFTKLLSENFYEEESDEETGQQELNLEENKGK